MPGDHLFPRHGLGRAALVTAIIASAHILSMTTARADPCGNPLIVGPAAPACESGQGPGIGGGSGLAAFTDNPLDSVAEASTTAASWIIGKLGQAVNATTQVNFANPGFLKSYGVVFAASTFLTIILWLLAVVKRAMRHVPIHQAVGEAVGFLWLTVIASAITPLILHYAVVLTDEVTLAIASTTKQDTEKFLLGFAQALDFNNQEGFAGGPIMLIFVSLLAIVGAAIVWVELLIRAALLYVGAVFACAVYAGLVDKSFWHHVRGWAGFMIAIILSKPVVVIVLGMATAVSANTVADAGADDVFSTVLTGLAILFLSIFASLAVYRFVPSFGNEMAALHSIRQAAATAGPAAMVSPTAMVKKGISTHANRRGGKLASAVTAGVLPAGTALGAGIAAHGARRAVTSAKAAAPSPAPRQGGEP